MVAVVAKTFGCADAGDQTAKVALVAPRAVHLHVWALDLQSQLLY